MSNEILDNIQELRERVNDTHPEEIERLEQTEKAVKRAMLTKALGENDAVLMLRTTLEHRVELCDRVLANDETLDELSRRDIFTRKKVYKWFLNLFTIAESRLGAINSKIVGKRAKK